MHIAEGILSAPVLAGGAVAAAGGIGIGLKRMDYSRLPRVALMSAVFFVVSLIHMPLGPTSIHLSLIGLVGLVLGWASFPAMFVALLLQALLFQHGGITPLGVNTVNMALPAVVMGMVFGPIVRKGSPAAAAAAGFAAGVLGVAGAVVMVWLALVLTGQPLGEVGKALVVMNLPVMGIEGVITAVVVGLLRRARPQVLQ